MDIWASALLIVLLAVVIDAVIGDPPNSVHPLRWLGNLIGWLDRRISRKGTASTKIKGLLSFILAASMFISIALLLSAASRMLLGEIAWIIVSAVLFKFTFAIFSFRRHCRPIIDDMGSGDLDSAAGRTQMIVSRCTEGMDREHLSSCCVETTAENFADSVCSPGFFFGLFGIFGAVMFRTANMMDAMWGYRNERYGDIGFFAAKFDDVLGFLTSRMSIIFIAAAAFLLRMDGRSAIRTALEQHDRTPSPNSGWPMAAVAGAMGITMEKKGVHVIGSGPLPSVNDIRRCYVLVELSSLIFMFVVTAFFYVIIGVHIQLSMENTIYRWIEGIL